jgi:hypothetical protein
MLERALHGVHILDSQPFVIEQHLNRRGQLRRTALVHGIQHLDRLGENELRDPGATRTPAPNLDRRQAAAGPRTAPKSDPAL